MATFQRTLVFSSHFTGGSPFGAMPVASGPRHWCQLSSAPFGNSSARAEGERQQRTKASVAVRFISGFQYSEDGLENRRGDAHLQTMMSVPSFSYASEPRALASGSDHFDGLRQNPAHHTPLH